MNIGNQGAFADLCLPLGFLPIIPSCLEWGPAEALKGPVTLQGEAEAHSCDEGGGGGQGAPSWPVSVYSLMKTP